MKRPKTGLLYDNTIPPTIGEDAVLAPTIMLPDRLLAHEPNELCWCSPALTPVYDDDGDELLYYTFEHRTMQ